MWACTICAELIVVDRIPWRYQGQYLALYISAFAVITRRTPLAQASFEHRRCRSVCIVHRGSSLCGWRTGYRVYTAYCRMIEPSRALTLEMMSSAIDRKTQAAFKRDLALTSFFASATVLHIITARWPCDTSLRSLRSK